MSIDIRQTLAWHETLEIHELVAFQSIGLIKLKMAIKKINDPELRKIYNNAIKGMELNVSELIKFYPSAPNPSREEALRNDLGFYAGDLLGLSKSLVRNYSIAITETATPILRETLVNQLLRAIKSHESVFNYMYKKGYYPSYDLVQLLNNDLKNAQKALSMDY
jgi:spore coat protein F